MQSPLFKKPARLKWLIPACLIGLTAALAFFPADDWSERVTKALAQYSQRFPQEKVYLHLDKDYYAGGETIWFKAYIMLQNQPSLAATNLYAELVDKNGTIVMKKRLVAMGAGAAGDFELPENIKAGQYRLRAYTAWMLNFDPAFLCYRDIEIFDPSKRNNLPADTTVNRDIDLQFFPEGGNMINGVAGNVAFKAIGQDGYPIAISGVVQDSRGQTVADIKTMHDGMGAFELTPAAGESYMALVKTGGGLQKSVPLPAAQTGGVGLKVYNKGSRIFYQTMPANPEDTSYNQLMLVAQMQQQLVYRAMLNVGEGRISGFIPTEEMPSGIIQLTLFSSSGTPLAERLAFIRKNDQLQLSLQDPSINTEERQKNSIVLKVPDSLRTSLSVAVTDADQVAKDKNQQTIVSSLLLTSDLKGNIYNPAWYFSDSTQEKAQALDLVMMTNGWRRFSWQKILNNEFPKIRYPYEEGLLLKGAAYTNNGRFPLMNGKVTFIFKQPLDSSTAFADAKTNEKGEFVMNGLQFMDTVQVYYQGNDPQKRWKDVQVEFTPHFFDRSAPITMPYPMRRPPALDYNVLRSFLATASEGNKVNRAITSRTVFLKEVNIRDKRITPQESIEKKYTSGMFSSADGYTFDLTKETPTSFNIFQYLQSRVAGLNIMGDYNNPSLSWRGGRPALYLDEMPVDVSMLSSININDVALIKVLRPPFMGGFGGGNGAIAVYTKRGNDNTSDPNVRGFSLYRKAGYNLVKEFYSPNYAVRKEVHSLPDKRLTLYWNPNLQVDSLTHTARITFYNNDFSKRFRVVVEGIGEDGSVGRVEQVY